MSTGSRGEFGDWNNSTYTEFVDMFIKIGLALLAILLFSYSAKSDWSLVGSIVSVSIISGLLAMMGLSFRDLYRHIQENRLL